MSKYYINYELDTPEGFQPGDCWDCPLHYIKDFDDEPEVCCIFDKCPIQENEVKYTIEKQTCMNCKYLDINSFNHKCVGCISVLTCIPPVTVYKNWESNERQRLY